MAWKIELIYVQLTPPGSACSIAFGEGLGIDCRWAVSAASRS